MKVKVSEVTGKVLDYLVAKAEGWTFNDWHQNDGDWQVWAEKVDAEGRGPAGYFPADSRLHFSTDWAQGGPIIEREKIGVLPDDGHRFSQWRAFCWHPSQHDLTFEDATSHMEAGPTPLIAAMRCFVASRLGDEVDVPEELLA